MAVAVAVAVPVAVPVAGLTKRFFKQKDFLINVWGHFQCSSQLIEADSSMFHTSLQLSRAVVGCRRNLSEAIRKAAESLDAVLAACFPEQERKGMHFILTFLFR